MFEGWRLCTAGQMVPARPRVQPLLCRIGPRAGIFLEYPWPKLNLSGECKHALLASAVGSRGSGLHPRRDVPGPSGCGGAKPRGEPVGSAEGDGGFQPGPPAQYRTPAAEKALKAAHIDGQQVKNAVSRLSDDELAQLAKRAEKAQKDFAAGTLSDRDLIIILLAVVALILIIVAVR